MLFNMALCYVLQRCATAGDSCNDILMLDGKMPAIVVSADSIMCTAMAG
jgi:hypothetical protein